MKKIMFFIVASAFFIWHCSEPEDWRDPIDTTPPGSISDPVVENMHGGARITYTLPSDDDLLGVKAVYYYNEGEYLESFSSAYKDTIELHGFPDTRERTVKLIALDLSRNESEPVEVVIQPLTPPIELIRESLIISRDFGGLFLFWSNISESHIGIMLSAVNDMGEMIYDHTYYSNSSEDRYSFRGYPAVETEFKIQIVDRWDNFSAPIDTVLTPIFEQQIMGRDEHGRHIWEQYGFMDLTSLWRGDISTGRRDPSDPRHFTAIHDEIWTSTANSYYWHTFSPNHLIVFTGDPDDDYQMESTNFTIDLGREVNINRSKIYMTPLHRFTYSMRYFEVWATNETPKGGPDDFDDQMESLAYWTEWSAVGGTGAWKDEGGWFKIIDDGCIPPSGVTRADQVTADDFAHAFANGFEFEAYRETVTQPIRYVRFVMGPMWNGSSYLTLGQLQFFGNYVD